MAFSICKWHFFQSAIRCGNNVTCKYFTIDISIKTEITTYWLRYYWRGNVVFLSKQQAENSTKLWKPRKGLLMCQGTFQVNRNHSVNDLSHTETTPHCNVVSRWLNTHLVTSDSVLCIPEIMHIFTLSSIFGGFLLIDRCSPESHMLLHCHCLMISPQLKHTNILHWMCAV